MNLKKTSLYRFKLSSKNYSQTHGEQTSRIHLGFAQRHLRRSRKLQDSKQLFPLSERKVSLKFTEFEALRAFQHYPGRQHSDDNQSRARGNNHPSKDSLQR